MFIATTLNPDIGLTFPTTLRGLELGPYTKRAVNVFCQYTRRAAMSLLCHCYVTALSQVRYQYIKTHVNQI